MSINSGDRPWPQTLSHDGVDWPTDEQRVLVPFHEAVNRTETSLLGASIAFGTDGELYLLHTVDPDAPEDTDAIRHESELKKDVHDEFQIPIVQEGRVFSEGVLDSFVDSHSITTTVVDRAETAFFSRGRDEASVAKNCHNVVGTGMSDFDAPASILVPVAKGPHSGLATRIAEAVARAYDSWIELFHVLPEDASERDEGDATKLLDAYAYRLGDDVDIDYHVTRAADPADAIVEHTEYHDLTVLGAPEKGKLRRFFFGSTADEVTDTTDAGPVLTAHRNTGKSVLSRWL